VHGEALTLPLFAPRPARDPVAAERLPLWSELGQQLGNRDVDGLRPYQREAVTRIWERLAVGRSTLLVMATGLGKTQTFGAIAKHHPGRVLVLAHRSELLEQGKRRMEQMCQEPVGLEQAVWWAAGERIVVASVQTLGRKVRAGQDDRLGRFAAAPFTLVIVDEAHHTTAATYRRILDAFPGAKVLGVTATPDRGDGEALGQIYDSVAYVRDIEDGITDGYLVPVLGRHVQVDKVDLSRVHTTAGELNQGELDEEMVKANEAVATECLELCGSRKTIVFTTGVETAHDLVATFNKMAGADVAVAVDGKTPWDQRREILAEHTRGETQFLVNVGIATEGYDCPGVGCVAIARPTKSRALYTQMAGRGLRVLPGLVEGVDTPEERRALVAASGKPDCLLIHFAVKAGRHRLVCPTDILGGREAGELDDETRARAAELLAKGSMRADDAARLAREEIEAERKRRAAQIRGVKSDVRARVSSLDPFGGPGAGEAGGELATGGAPASPGQKMALIRQWRWKEREVAALSRDEAQKQIRREHARLKAGLATHPQERELRRRGIDTERMYKATASALMAAIEANGWHDLPPAQVEAIVHKSRHPGQEG
jgi:superfamily II DNA or RNA helicase